MADLLYPALEILRAVHFAADRHRDQRRKDVGGSPYINHPIEVAEILARIGGISDLAVLQAAILHDTIEDTETSAEVLEAVFGAEVRDLVEEVTDDKSLPKEERKQRQIAHSPHLSGRAKMIKLADKTCNIRDVAHSPPADWSVERRTKYLDWSEAVIAGCRGVNKPLERYFDEVLRRAREVVKHSD
ncbi:MAG TPA: HD domain-containing protein [Gammaproteobacteria bacterium]